MSGLTLTHREPVGAILTCMRGTLLRSRLAPVGVVIAVVLPVLSVLATVLADRKLQDLGRSDLHELHFDPGSAVYLVAIVASSAVGALLLIRRDGHPVGWAFVLLSAALSVTAGTEGYAKVAYVADPAGDYPLRVIAIALTDSSFIFLLMAIAFVAYLTPTGAYLTRRWALAGRIICVETSYELVEPGAIVLGERERCIGHQRARHLRAHCLEVDRER